MTGPRLPTRSIALCLLLAPAVALASAPVVADHGDGGADRFVAQQGENCVDLRALGDGDENVSAFYDYRYGNNTGYSSHGTEHLQRPNVSQFFLYRGTEGLSLVFLHGAYDDPAEGGGAVTMTVEGLPADRTWAVEDDDYPGGTDDRWNHGETTSEIHWMWADGRNDGGAVHDLRALEDGAITLSPAFGEASYAYQERDSRWPWADEENQWRVRDGDGTLHALEKSESVRIERGRCGTPPAAHAAVNQSTAAVGETVAFDASASYDEDDVAAYEWEITRGERSWSADGERVSRSFDGGGTVTATVTVTDETGATATATTTVTVDDAPPVARASANRTTVAAGEPVRFEGSASTDDGGIERYAWAFGDGEDVAGAPDDAAAVVHRYDSPGEYEATLTVRDGTGNENATTVPVTVTEPDDPPTAALAADDAASVDETVAFDASESTDDEGIERYRWDVDGDGEIEETTTGPRIERRFSTPGDHAVTVEVVDAAGQTDDASATVAVSDEGDDPEAAASANRTTVTVGESVRFDGSGSTDDAGIASHEWTFGDGEDATGETVDHRYDSPGEYEATLTVTDADGNADETTVTVSVGARESDGDDDGNDGNDGNDGDDGNDDEDSNENDGNDDDDSDGDDDDNDAGGGGFGDLSPAPAPDPEAAVDRADDGTLTVTVEDATAGETVVADVESDGAADLQLVGVTPAADADELTLAVTPGADPPAPAGATEGLVTVDTEANARADAEAAPDADAEIRSMTYQFAVERSRLGGRADRVRAFANRSGDWERIDHEVVANDSTVRVNATTNGTRSVLLASARPNVTSTSLVPEGSAVAGEPTTLRATLTNDGVVAANRTVALAVGDRTVDETRVSVPAGGEATVAFEATFAEPGDARVSLAGRPHDVAVRDPSAALDLANLTVEPTRVDPGERFEVAATFENDGAADGSTTANLTVEGDVVAQQRVAVPAGERASVTFTHTIDAPGEYAVGVDGEGERVVVADPATTDASNATAATTPGDGPADAGLVVAGLGVLVVAAAAVSRLR